MKTYLGMLLMALPLLGLVTSAEAAGPQENPRVRLKTTMGEITIELYADKAPVSMANFLTYVKEGFYAGTIFHRIVPGFVIQGGGLTPAMVEKPTRAQIKNEAGNGLKNDRGTLAMARTMMPDSATSQFYINLKDNAMLNYRDASPQGIGYAVFGRVVEGMDVVDKIAATPTKRVGPHEGVPATPVVIESAEVVTSK